MIVSLWCASALVVLAPDPTVREADTTGATAAPQVPIEDVAEATPNEGDEPQTDPAATEDEPSETRDLPPVPSPSLAAGGAVEPHPAIVGGYWDMERAHGREPDDGREHIIVGSILLPLGVIAASTAAATVWLSAPGHCKERWAALDAAPTAQQCRGTHVFGIIRVAYGSLMAVTGATLLGIGMHRRELHRKWSRRQSFEPYFGSRGGGLTWTLRFGGRG